MSAQQSSAAYAVIYDGYCKVCGKIARRLAEWDRDHLLEIIASQSPEVSERFPWISQAAMDRSMQVIRLSDGRTSEGGAAVEEIVNLLTKRRLSPWLFRIPFARGIVDRAYWIFARNRYRFGCGDHCRIGN